MEEKDVSLIMIFFSQTAHPAFKVPILRMDLTSYRKASPFFLGGGPIVHIGLL